MEMDQNNSGLTKIFSSTAIQGRSIFSIPCLLNVTQTDTHVTLEGIMLFQVIKRSQ